MLPYVPIFLLAIIEGEIYYIAMCVAATAGKLSWAGVMIAGATDAQPGGKDSLPAFVIRARCQFRNVIDRSVRFDAAEFPKVVDGMTTIRRTAANAQYK